MEIDMPRVFDYLAGARKRLLGWVCDLHAERPAVYAQAFPFGLGSIRATLLHVAAAEWAYVERLAGRDLPLSDAPFTVERLPELNPFARAWDKQAAATGAALRALGDPARPVEFISRAGPAPMLARATAGEIVLHMALHEVHHRAQVMAMLRQCGVRAENIDYSFLAFTRTPLVS
ncbi:MAG TPA: DinB family protein [bacterium]|nr:DinB family protein [bacterium]